MLVTSWFDDFFLEVRLECIHEDDLKKLDSKSISRGYLKESISISDPIFSGPGTPIC